MPRGTPDQKSTKKNSEKQQPVGPTDQAARAKERDLFKRLFRAKNLPAVLEPDSLEARTRTGQLPMFS